MVFRIDFEAADEEEKHKYVYTQIQTAHVKQQQLRIHRVERDIISFD